MVNHCACACLPVVARACTCQTLVGSTPGYSAIVLSLTFAGHTLVKAPA